MKKRINWPFLFIAPFFIIYGIFNLFPILFSFYISLTKWKGFGPMEFIGFDNYVALLQDKAFYRSVFNSFMIVLEAMIPIQSLGLILALLMNYGIWMPRRHRPLMSMWEIPSPYRRRERKVILF